MSSLTSYQVVAAIMTLVVLGLLSYVKNLWQEFELVREITYWLSISGRSGEFIRGLICSEDVIYFITVSALFLVLTVIRLQANRPESTLDNDDRKVLKCIVDRQRNRIFLFPPSIDDLL